MHTTNSGTNHAGVVPAVETAILVVILAPLLGAIASAIRCEERWVVGGVLVAIAMTLLMLVVSSGQTSAIA